MVLKEPNSSDFIVNLMIGNVTGSVDIQKQNSSDTNLYLYPPALLNYGAICSIAIAVMGITGNLISIIALAKCTRLRNATTVFIINLSIADLLFCIVPLPLRAVSFFERKWSYGETICKFIPIFTYTNGAVSLWSMIAIAINRYVLIVHPAKYSSIYRPRYIAIMILIMWTEAIFLVALPVFEVWGMIGYYPKVATCDILKKDGKSPIFVMFSSALGLPLVSFTFCYSRIYCVVRRSSQIIRKSCRIGSTEIISISRRCFGKSLVLNVPREQEREYRILCMMVVITINFVLCYYPISIVMILKEKNDLPVLYILAYLAFCFSTCVNPIIYVATSKDYRQSYIELFTSCRQCPHLVNQVETLPSVSCISS